MQTDQSDIESRANLPPGGVSSFPALFRYAYDRGLGRGVGDSVEPWTLEALEAAFSERARPVSLRSLENWRSGKSLPRKRNLHTLATIFAAGDRRTRDAWLTALLASDLKEGDAGSVAGQVSHGPDAELIENLLSSLSVAVRSGAVGFGVACLAVVGVIVGASTLDRDGNRIVDMAFCTPEDFDAVKLVCLTSREFFPEGTKVIKVSFGTAGVDYGQPFERRWYRNGRIFLEREGFFDDAWEGWTWLGNPNGHDVGRYHLRVIVEGDVTTGSFTIGEPDRDASALLPDPF